MRLRPPGPARDVLWGPRNNRYRQAWCDECCWIGRKRRGRGAVALCEKDADDHNLTEHPTTDEPRL